MLKLFKSANASLGYLKILHTTTSWRSPSHDVSKRARKNLTLYNMK